MEIATAVLAGTGVLLSLLFMLAGSLLVIVPPAVALAAGAGHLTRASRQTGRAGTAPA